MTITFFNLTFEPQTEILFLLKSHDKERGRFFNNNNNENAIYCCRSHCWWSAAHQRMLWFKILQLNEKHSFHFGKNLSLLFNKKDAITSFFDLLRLTMKLKLMFSQEQQQQVFEKLIIWEKLNWDWKIKWVQLFNEPMMMTMIKLRSALEINW